MSDVADQYKKELPALKENVEESYKYFEKNYKRFNEYLNFAFVSTVSDEQASKLAEIGKPPLQFNIIEPYISHQLGEFVESQPGVVVKPAEGLTYEDMSEEFQAQIDTVESHLREILTPTNNDSLGYQVFKDILTGGFSTVEVYTDYINSMSFEQNINVERVFSPCLTGFDPMARQSHKGDGMYCFQIIPRTKEDFEREFGRDSTKNMRFERDISGFSWSFKSGEREIVLVADYYKKVFKKKTLVKLSRAPQELTRLTPAMLDEKDRHIIKRAQRKVLFKKQYNRLMEIWEEQQFLEQPPVIVDERQTQVESIERYQLTESDVLNHETTNYEHLPLVFFDGNSITLKTSAGSSYEQVTRPYIYNAKGAQMLKDFAGQTMAQEIENMMQSKLIAPIEGIPENYTDAYTDYQKADVIVYNAFHENDLTVSIPPPREIQRTQTPSVVTSAFAAADQLIQSTLGSYNAQLGIQNKELSGKAIQQGASQSNNASRPYLMGYMRGLNRVAQIILSLIPKYYITPRSIPVLLPSGKRDYKIINATNAEQAVFMNYDPHSMMVEVSAGASFGVQKQQAIEHITQLMKVSPLISEFISEDGLEILLDNVDFRGSDRLKSQIEDFITQYKQRKQQQQQMQQQQMQMQQQQQQQQQQMAKQNMDFDHMMKVAKLTQDSEAQKGKQQIDEAKVAIDNKESDIDYIKAIADMRQDQIEAALRSEKIDAENARSAVEAAVKLGQHFREIQKDIEQGQQSED